MKLETKIENEWFRLVMDSGVTFDVIDKNGRLQIRTIDGAMDIYPLTSNMVTLNERDKP